VRTRLLAASRRLGYNTRSASHHREHAVVTAACSASGTIGMCPRHRPPHRRHHRRAPTVASSASATAMRLNAVRMSPLAASRSSASSTLSAFPATDPAALERGTSAQAARGLARSHTPTAWSRSAVRTRLLAASRRLGYNTRSASHHREHAVVTAACSASGTLGMCPPLHPDGHRFQQYRRNRQVHYQHRLLFRPRLPPHRHPPAHLPRRRLRPCHLRRRRSARTAQ